jgi:hypothetical protein
LSTLDEEVERFTLEVWLVAIVAFAIFKELSTLEEELERERLDV